MSFGILFMYSISTSYESTKFYMALLVSNEISWQMFFGVAFLMAFCLFVYIFITVNQTDFSNRINLVFRADCETITISKNIIVCLHQNLAVLDGPLK